MPRATTPITKSTNVIGNPMPRATIPIPKSANRIGNPMPEATNDDDRWNPAVSPQPHARDPFYNFVFSSFPRFPLLPSSTTHHLLPTGPPANTKHSRGQFPPYLATLPPFPPSSPLPHSFPLPPIPTQSHLRNRWWRNHETPQIQNRILHLPSCVTLWQELR